MPQTDIGLEVVDFVYRRMQIDPEWSVRRGRGFTWWGGMLAQRVLAEPCCGSASGGRAAVPRAAAGLRFRERRQYLRAVQEALAGAGAARAVLEGVVKRMEGG